MDQSIPFFNHQWSLVLDTRYTLQASLIFIPKMIPAQAGNTRGGDNRYQGCQIWAQSGSDWPQMGQIQDFFRSDSVHFGSARQNVLKLILKSPRFSHLEPIKPTIGQNLPSLGPWHTIHTSLFTEHLSGN